MSGPAPRLYLCTYDRACGAISAPGPWQAKRLAPLVLLPRQDAALYDPGMQESEVREWCDTLGERLGGPWYAAFWAMNNRDTCCLAPWDDDAAWDGLCRRLGWVRSAAPAAGCRGVLLDLELYLWTPDLSGGQMRKPAWRDHPRIPERAAQYAAALEGLVLGGYVWAPEIGRLAGLRRWLQALFAAAEGGLLLGEDYLNGGAEPGWGKRLGARYVPGVRGVRRAPGRGAVWVWDP